VLLADAGPVCELAASIDDEMRRCGLGTANLKAAAPFVPHMTLAYDQKHIRPVPVEPITFTAREFVLIHSLKGLGIYRFLGRWPLVG
jgi:2'-5' RNA ligase